MAKFFDELTPKQIEFIEQQKLFFTASGTADSRINLSPKGMDTFRVIDPGTVAYLDLTGSGNETAAHLKHDGRLTIMFCSFSGAPLILRLYGHGEVVSRDAVDWQTWSDRFGEFPAVRQIVKLRVESVQASCGYGVPEFEFKASRTKLTEWAESKSESQVKQYWEQKNGTSIDGLDTGLLG